MAKAGPNHKHRWKLEGQETATSGKCWCGAKRTFTGGYDHTSFKSGEVWFNENDRKRIIKAVLQ